MAHPRDARLWTAPGARGSWATAPTVVVVGGQCPQLHPRLDPLDLFGQTWPDGRVGFVAPSQGEPLAFPESDPPTAPITERADGRTWSVAPDGFWQVHPGAADALVGHVRRMLDPRAGERLVDLYAGVGLFGLEPRGGRPRGSRGDARRGRSTRL